MRKYFPILLIGWTVMIVVTLLTNLYILGGLGGDNSVDTTYHKEYPTPVQAITYEIIIVYAVMYLLGIFVFLYFRLLLKRHNLEMEAKNKELQDINAAKDKFFSVIAHDLKTPAANIESLSQTLKEKYDDLSKEDRINCVDMLVESARTHNDLLNTMLDLSRLRLGSKQYLPERIDVCKLAEGVLDQTKLQAQQKGITTINQTNECYAKADKNMVTTVLRNIVVNAIKFTSPGGQITVRAEATGATIVVSIADTGIGINDAMKSRIFEVDYNKSTAGTANESGTGLGLVLCKEYVERNGGKIWVESEVGVGSTFFFTLPIYR